MQKFSKVFKVLLSVGIGLMVGSVFVYKLNSVSIQQSSKIEPDLKEKIYGKSSNKTVKEKIVANKQYENNVKITRNNIKNVAYTETAVVSKPKVIRIIRREFVKDNYQPVAKSEQYLSENRSLSYYRPNYDDVRKIQQNADTYDYLRSQHSPEYYQNEQTVKKLEDRGYLSVNDLAFIKNDDDIKVFYEYKVVSPDTLRKLKANNYYKNNNVNTKVISKPRKVINAPNNWDVFDGNFVLSADNIGDLKSNTVITGNLYIMNFNWVKLPENIKVIGNVYVQNSQGVLFRYNTVIEGSVFMKGNSSLKAMSENVKIKGQVFLG